MTVSELDLFYGKVKFSNLGFSIRKWKTVEIWKLLQPVAWKFVDADN